MSNNNDSPWGNIIPSSIFGDDEPDKIDNLIKEYEEIKKKQWTDGTLKEFEERKKKELQQKEKEIWDAIYVKRMRR